MHVYTDKVQLHGQRFFDMKHSTEETYPRAGILRKWTPICLAMDFQENQAKVAYNGLISEKMPPEDNPMNQKAYQLKYGGDMMTQELKQENINLTVIIGRYWFDKRAIIGKMVGVSLWSRFLDDEEMLRYINCSKILISNGDLINQRTTWHHSANLVTPYEVNIKELECKNLRGVPAFIPSRGFSKQEAVDVCHKFGGNVGLAGEVSTEEDFRRFYDLLQSDQAKAYREESAHVDGGRVLTWFPYTLKDINGTIELLHDISNKPLGVEFWGPGIVPNYNEDYRSTKNLCLKGYMGLWPYGANLRLGPCDDNRYGAACLLGNSQRSTTMVEMRGLCRYSAFDKFYMVEYTA